MHRFLWVLAVLAGCKDNSAAASDPPLDRVEPALPSLDARVVTQPVLDEHEPSARPEDANPLVDGGFRMGQRPQHVAADDEIEAPGWEGQLLDVAFLEADRNATRVRLAPRSETPAHLTVR